MPVRRRRDNAVHTVKKTPHTLRYENGVLIQNDSTTTTVLCTLPAEQYQSDVDTLYVTDKRMLDRNERNVMCSAFFAVNMYLEPVNVAHSIHYWLAQYVNYRLPECEWFIDHIKSIMIHPVSLQLSTAHGIAYSHSSMSKYTLLMQLMGSGLHRIPSEYFVQKDCVEVLECLYHLIDPQNQCFLVKNTGLEGEIELAAFKYNKILSYFYEPSFIIITSYLLYIHYLLSIPMYRTLNHFLPHIRNITQPIRHTNIPYDTLFSISRENTNYTEKRRVFDEDLLDLCDALDLLDIDSIKNQLTLLWSKKASYVTDLITPRLSDIYNQVHL